MLENTFNAVLNMSITASVAALLIVFFRRIFGNKLPRILSYALWAIVLLRLLIPLSLPSIFSIFNAIPVPETIMTQNPQYHGTDNYIPYSKDYGSIPQEKTALNNNINGTFPAATPEASAAPMQVLVFVIPWLWLVGAVGLFSFSIFAYFRSSRRLKEAVLYKHDDLISQCSRKLKMNRQVKIYTSDRVHTPVVCGLIKACIILPLALTQSCNELELKHIITHELVHIKRFDYILKLLSIIALCVHWFNPVMWVGFILSQKDMEMSCDEKVMSLFDNDIRSEYATSLIKLAAKQNVLLNGGLLAFGESNIKSRIKGIMNFKKPGFWLGTTAVVIFVAIGMVLLTNGQYKEDNNKNLQHKAEENTNSDNHFAIYLVKNAKTKTASEMDINNLELENTPIISDKDIKSYKWPTHSFELNIIPDKIPSVPMAGLPFVVVADGERIYMGAFWTSFSSVSASIPVIDILEKPFAINMGYPGKREDVIDPRNDKRIYNALREAGILALSSDTGITEGNSDELPLESDRQLWTNNGWTYYLEQIPRGGSIPLNDYVGRLYRQHDDATKEILDELVKYSDQKAVVFPAGDRIVFIGFAGIDIMDFKTDTIISIKQDGCDRRTYNTKFNVAGQLCYDNGYLYYEGWTNDRVFPRPVCRIDTSLSKDIKMADIDGSLITVYDGYAYYLNGSIYRLKLDWSSKPEIWDKAAIGKNIISVQKIADNEYNVIYDEKSKPYILRLPDEKRKAFNVVQKYFIAFENADYKSMGALATEGHNKNLIHDGDVWGMRWARAKEIELVENPAFLGITSAGSTLVYGVSVDMETAKTSAQYPSTETFFYVVLVKGEDGVWRVDRYTTG